MVELGGVGFLQAVPELIKGNTGVSGGVDKIFAEAFGLGTGCVNGSEFPRQVIREE